MMASPTPPSGSLGGIIDDRGDHAADQGHAAVAAEESSGNVGMSLRPPGPGQGLMYADLQGGRHNNSLFQIPTTKYAYLVNP